MKFQAFKVKVNRILDERMAMAGRTLTFDERRAWWITNDRYLALFDDDLRQLEIIQDAQDFRAP